MRKTIPKTILLISRKTSHRKSDFLLRIWQSREFDSLSRLKDLIRTISYEGSGANVISGSQLRTYRLALAATGEYTKQSGGGTDARKALRWTADFNYEPRQRRLWTRSGDRMVIIANNDQIIYTDGTTDPYTNSSGSQMLGQNTTNLNTVIGTANYDIGHVFSTGGGGVATSERSVRRKQSPRSNRTFKSARRSFCDWLCRPRNGTSMGRKSYI